MNNFQEEIKFNSNPDTYYIGDLCYIIKDELWSEFCGLLFDNTSSIPDLKKLIFYETEILVGNTYYGDGLYQSDCCHLKILVDSGLIALVKISGNAINNEELKKYPNNIIKFDNIFESYLKEGIFYFGNCIIDTKNSDNEDYEEEENFDDEEDE